VGRAPAHVQAAPAEQADGAAAAAARSFYAAVNRRDIDGAVRLMATDVAYEDLQLFPEALNGHSGVRELFADWGELEPDVLFVVDDVTQQAAGAAGVLWHLEVRAHSSHRRSALSLYERAETESTSGTAVACA
jgi:ketosteroid isomerase-like protein